jgi:hypothetical protein
MTGIWWLDIAIMGLILIIILYVKPYDDRPSTLERAEVDELERMWRL